MKLYLSNRQLLFLMRCNDLFEWWGTLILLILIVTLFGAGVYLALSALIF